MWKLMFVIFAVSLVKADNIEVNIFEAPEQVQIKKDKLKKQQAKKAVAQRVVVRKIPAYSMNSQNSVQQKSLQVAANKPIVYVKKKKKPVNAVGTNRNGVMTKTTLPKQVIDQKSAAPLKNTSTNTSAPKVTAVTKEKEKSPWSHVVEGELDGKFDNEASSLVSLFAYYGKYNFTKQLSAQIKLALSRGFGGQDTDYRFGDTRLTVMANPIFNAKETGTRLFLGSYFYLPTSDQSHEQSLQGAVQPILGGEQDMTKYFTVQYRFFPRMNFHKYKTSPDKEDGSEGSPNIQYAMNHELSGRINFTENFNFVSYADYARASDYDGYTKDKAVFTQELNYEINSHWAATTGFSTENTVYTDNSQQTKLRAFDNDVSVWYFDIDYSF